jgi:GT2 family glycosyltransferase
MSSHGPSDTQRTSAGPPDVSIVIPVYNKLELTRVCVDSIHDVAVDHTFEIIVVDNGSSDGTAAWLGEQESLGRVRRVDNPENLGFSQGCNRGAAAARGRYILFLNNDMEVLPGWLEPMVTCLDQDPQAGIVGACLIFADETIQHGGVAMIDTNASGRWTIGGTHLSYKAQLDFPAARKNQIMQVVTGACLLIRPEVFAEIGGFDQTYWNGNEDVDLCLKAGELGWRVVYMGDSLLYHYESQSGEERWVKTQPNVDYFNKVWRDRARVDYVHEGGKKFRSTEHNQIRAYTLPNLNPHLPLRTDPPRASVIVLTWNALEYIRQCADGLLAHTDPRHELIFVDNGSQQETRDYLTRLAADHEQIQVIFNETNLGFAAGNNVGLAAATGQYVCLLNSDAVVTAGWLERLMRPLEGDPRLGLIGPVTNSITGMQKLEPVDYDERTLEGLADFAARRAVEHEGEVGPSLWIVGFCLLMRRELIMRVGGLDEGFGLGNFEDTDFCLRAFLTGYGAAVAVDCFVHHFGSRSFVENNLDYGKMLDEKFEIFRRKWDLAADARETGDFELVRLIHRGFVPGLHFQPLPASPHYSIAPLAPWQAEQWVDRGEREFKAGQTDAAQRIFRTLLERVPGHARASNDLACVLWQTDTDGAGVAAAKRILNELLAREPDNADAQWNLEQIEAQPVAEEACTV